MLFNVMSGAMMFGPIVCSVVGTWAPVVSELALGITAAEPVESHVNCLGATGLDVVGDHAKGSAVVGLDWCGRLFVTHFFENLSHWNCFAGVDVEGAKFDFGCT
jgi:hypothetical protein